ncbi:MAG: ACP S-malonyltransferase [Planctomycetes bacterium]|nr:ACP S-malonyltransferase [Planctomycetota bacterium]
MITLLADVNIQGQAALLASCMQAAPWREFWDHLNLRLVTFADVGLDPSASDAVIWRRCQNDGILLLTDNRNDDGPESLAATIRANSQDSSLPVFTIANIRGVANNPEYRHRVIDRLLRYLLELENIRGTGRLFLP